MRTPKMFLVWYFWKDYTKLIDVEPFNMMVSAGHHWDKDKGFYIPPLLPYRELMVDSGGFQLISKYEDYPFTVEEYMEYVKGVNPDYAVTLDYPCDERLDSSMPTEKRIQKTVENAEKMLSIEMEPQIVPVIQGETPEQYLHCLELYREKGLIQPLMGVGSICIRSGKEEVKKILRTLKKNVSCHLHCFGLNLGFLKDSELRRYVYSFDSFAWNYPATRYGRVFTFTGKRLVKLHSKGPQEDQNCNVKLDDWELQQLSLKAYQEYYDYLCDKWMKQTKIRQTGLNKK